MTTSPKVLFLGQALVPDTNTLDWKEESRVVPAATPELLPFLVANASAFERGCHHSSGAQATEVQLPLQKRLELGKRN